MGFWMDGKVDVLLDEGHFRFLAKFTWDKSADNDARSRFNRYKELIKDTGIHPKAIIGYYLRDPSGVDPMGRRIFVIIGLSNANDKKSRYGLELLCSKIIFDNNIKANLYFPVEANELLNVHEL